MESPTTPSDIPDIEILALMQEGNSLSDILKELVFLRRWKESQLLAQKEDSQRMERLLTRLCVSACIAVARAVSSKTYEPGELQRDRNKMDTA